jgi:hypothetical protein
MCVLENVGGCNGFYYNGVFQQGHNDNLSSLETMEELYLGEGMGGSGREKGSVKVMIESVYYHTKFMVYSRGQMNEN